MTEKRESNRRVGIYGGTFSPPHLGHLHAAKAFFSEMRLDELIVIPTLIPPHKTRQDTATAEDRLEMCRRTFAFSKAVTVSDLEIRRGGKSYTSDTLAALSGDGRTLLFLCGTDMFLTLEEWHEPEKIFHLAEIAFLARREDEKEWEKMEQAARLYQEKYGAVVHRLHACACENSSSAIRLLRKSGDEKWASLVAPAVAAYIKEKGLYL